MIRPGPRYMYLIRNKVSF